VREATAEATTPGVSVESGKWVVISSSKVFPSDCVCSPEGATKELSLPFGSLDRDLCILPDMGRSFMELQKALHESLEAFLTSFYISSEPSFRVPNFEEFHLYNPY
jgi:hypothetical protein